MRVYSALGTLCLAARLIAFASSQETYTTTLNYRTTDSFISFSPSNGSHLEKPRYRSNDQPPSRLLNDERIDRNSDNIRFDRRYDDVKINDNNEGSLKFDINDPGEVIDENLKVHPLTQPVTDRKYLKNYEDKKFDISSDYEDKKSDIEKNEKVSNFDRDVNYQRVTKNPADDFYANRKYNDQRAKSNFDSDSYFNTDFGYNDFKNRPPKAKFEENVDGEYLSKPYFDEDDRSKSAKERINEYSSEKKRKEQNLNDYISDPLQTKSDDQKLYGFQDEYSKSFDYYDDKYSKSQNPRVNLKNHQLEGDQDDQSSVKPSTKVPESRKDKDSSRRISVDEESDRHQKDQSYEKSHVDARQNDQNLNGYPTYSDDQKVQPRFSGQQILERSPTEERNVRPSSDLDKLNPDRRLDDAYPNRRPSDSNFEAKPGRRLSDDLIADRRLPDEDSERKVVSFVPERSREDRMDNEFYPDKRRLDEKINVDETTVQPRQESNISHFMTFNSPKDWEENKPKLNFPNKSIIERYKMATLHLDKKLPVFDFLRYFLSFIQPRDVPLDLLRDTLEGKVNVSTMIWQTLHIEMAFLVVISIFIIMMLIVPSTECYFCCRPRKYTYQRQRNSTLICFLSTYAIILCACMMTMLICNEEVSVGIDKIPETVEAALQDLGDYHAGTAVQLRKCLTRSLDIASEAILADLDNVEELLGKPVQALLSSETGVDEALNELMDVSNASQELAYKTDSLLRRAERAREFAAELSRETDDIRRDLERLGRDCVPEDRSLCAVLDPSGLHLALRLERVSRDDRLVRLRTVSRDNLTEMGRQARGEFLYVTHHIARSTLDARNLIRREVNTARAKVSDEARSIEASGSDMSNQLDGVRRLTERVMPYLRKFDYKRWIVGFGTFISVLFIWILLFGALCCRCCCSCAEGRVRSTLLWFVFFSCMVSMGLWIVLIATLALASHTEMMICRPLDDPEFRTIEAILETRIFIGRRLNVPLKDLIEKCNQVDAAYPAFQLDNTQRLEQITTHWTWNGLTRAFAKLRVDLTGLRILTPNLRERLQNLLYASGPNLTEHRIMIQGPILNKDLNALSDQVENVARQLTDRRTARSFQTLAVQMRDLLSRRVKPLMKMQDELVYQLATLELHLQPIQQKVNQTLTHLRNVQYYLDNQGEKIGQLKTKAFIDRMGSYLDQWRTHVLTDMSTVVSKCRPLWDILQGIKLLFCRHILGPLNGFWFATFICAVVMLLSTPSAHSVASNYWRQQTTKGSILLSRQGSPDTVVMARETWRSPPPPSVDSW